MLNYSHRVLVSFFIFLFVSVSYAQEAKVVAASFGDYIDQCEVSTVCVDGAVNLTCPSGISRISCASPKNVFITSVAYNGNLGGVEGADAICQQHADSTTPQIEGKYLAWIAAEDGTAPADRFTPHNGEYQLLDEIRTVVHTDFTELISAEDTLKAINIDENGDTIPVPRSTWTNVTTFGLFRTSPGGIPPFVVDQTCDSWQSSSPDARGRGGLVFSSDASWTDDPGAAAQCDEVRRLYCFQQ